MFPTTLRPVRALVAGAAVSLMLASCGTTPGDDPSPGGTSPAATATSTSTATSTTTASPGPGTASPSDPTTTPTAPAGPTGPPTAAPTAEPTAAPPSLVTYSGTAANAAFAFELPATWSVDGAFSDVGGTVTVLGEDGAPVGHLTVLMAWGAECGPDCSMPPVTHLGDVPGAVPLSNSGEFVVRTVAMDLTGAPELRNAYGWQDNVRHVTSLTDAEVPPPTRMLPHVMYGLGLVETGVVAPNGITYRTVIFSSLHDFPTLDAARAWTRSEEHRQVQAMIASFRA
jgi:hypothetical protein